MSAQFVLTDRWKTHFGSLQTLPLIAVRSVDGRMYPRFRLDFSAKPEPAVSSAESSAPQRTAAEASRSRFVAQWIELSDAASATSLVPVKAVADEWGALRCVELGASLPVLCKQAVAVDDALLDDAQLRVERMQVQHLPRALLLDFELFGEDSSLILDFAAGRAVGYCAIDTLRDEHVGHVVVELLGEPSHTLLYTTFATNDQWRGRGVAKAMVSPLHQWAFAQPSIQFGRMHVRAGHAEIIGLYRHYGFDLVEHDLDVDGELTPYEDGQPTAIMGGPLKFEVFAKRLGWSWQSREEFVLATRSVKT